MLIIFRWLSEFDSDPAQPDFGKIEPLWQISDEIA
jgi:hypothetical protein